MRHAKTGNALVDGDERWTPRRRLFAAAVRIVLSLGIVLCVGCRPALNSVQLVLDRHTHAIAKLPEEQRPRLMGYGQPVVSEQAELLLPTGILSLEAARATAVRANPDIHATYARLERARARIAEARASYYPTLSLTHTSTRTFQTPASRNRLNTLLQPTPAIPTDTDTQSFAVTTLLNAIRLPLFGGIPAKGDRNSFSEHSTAMTATWTLFDGFVREARLLAAKHLYRASEASSVDVQRLIVHAVDSAYFQTQLAEEQVRIARADEVFSQEQFEETQKLRAAGRATVADVNNFRVRVLAAQAELTAASGLKETGRVLLAELLGLSGAALPDDLALSPLAAETEEEMTTPHPEPWIERATKNRPDLLELEHLVKNVQEQLRGAKGLYLPTVTLSGSWGYDRTSNLRYTLEDQSSAGALDFRWDLFTGGARRARVRMAQSSLAEAEAMLKRLRLAVQSQVRQAIIDLNDAQQQIRLRSETLVTARDNRRVVLAGYVAGKETLNRLNEAQRDVIEADANLALARIRLRQAWTDLHAAAAAYRIHTEKAQADETPG